MRETGIVISQNIQQAEVAVTIELYPTEIKLLLENCHINNQYSFEIKMIQSTNSNDGAIDSDNYKKKITAIATDLKKLHNIKTLKIKYRLTLYDAFYSFVRSLFDLLNPKNIEVDCAQEPNNELDCINGSFIDVLILKKLNELIKKQGVSSLVLHGHFLFTHLWKEAIEIQQYGKIFKAFLAELNKRSINTTFGNNFIKCIASNKLDGECFPIPLKPEHIQPPLCSAFTFLKNTPHFINKDSSNMSILTYAKIINEWTASTELTSAIMTFSANQTMKSMRDIMDDLIMIRNIISVQCHFPNAISKMTLAYIRNDSPSQILKTYAFFAMHCKLIAYQYLKDSKKTKISPQKSTTISTLFNLNRDEALPFLKKTLSSHSYQKKFKSVLQSCAALFEMASSLNI